MSDSSPLDPVRVYYDQFAEREWERLTNPQDGVIEFALTCRALLRHLPESGTVLDVGGGPGRYSIWLAERGYRVVLMDLSPGLIDIARKKIREAGVESSFDQIAVGDARDLTAWADCSFDAALSLGPFYHLPDEADRECAATELARVLRPGSPAFIALMPRYALLRRTMSVPDERHHLMEEDWLVRLMEEGTFENDVPGRFNCAYGVRPQEVVPFFERFGLASREMLGAQSLAVGFQEQFAQIADGDPALFDRIVSLLDNAASDPSILGLCSHLLYIGGKIEKAAPPVTSG